MVYTLVCYLIACDPLPTILKITAFELVRLLMTRRGLVSIVAFLLVWLLIFRYAIWPASSFLRNNDGDQLLSWVLSKLDAGSLTTWAVPELGVYWFFALWLLPFYSLVVTADQTASDRARGTLRFLHLRATRTDIFFGRFLGQLLILFLFIALTLLSTLAVAVYRDAQTLTPGLQHCAQMLPQLMLVLLPFTALMALMSIVSKSARVALLYAIIAWIVLKILVSVLLHYVPTAVELAWILPGSQLPYLKSLGLQHQPVVYLVPLLQSAVLLVVGWLVVRRINL